MIFMFLFYSDEGAIAGLSREDRNGLVERHVRYNHEVLERRATVLATRGLDPSHEAVTVRPANGVATVRPGPAVSANLALAGFYLVECDDLAAAVELAKLYPMPEGLGSVEIRPVMRAWDYAPSVDTPASPAAVWRCYEDLDTWPSWKHGVVSVTLDGPFEAGASGTLTATGAAPMAFRIVSATPGAAYGSETDVVPDGTLRMEHTLEPLPDGGTRITHRATVPRAILDVLGLEFSPALYAGMHASLQALAKVACEADPSALATPDGRSAA